jgi:hypothetical protein
MKIDLDGGEWVRVELPTFDERYGFRLLAYLKRCGLAPSPRTTEVGLAEARHLLWASIAEWSFPVPLNPRTVSEVINPDDPTNPYASPIMRVVREQLAAGPGGWSVTNA